MVIRTAKLACSLVLALAACSEPRQPISVILDMPDGELAPAGYASLELRLRGEGIDDQRRVAYVDGAFDLGTIEPINGVSIEVVLRGESGTIVGYGRSGSALDLVEGDSVAVPVRRPIVYMAGAVSTDPNPNVSNDERWTSARPTFLDLTSQANGFNHLARNAAFMVAAGPRMFVIEQEISSLGGVLVGDASIVPVDDSAHALGTAITSLAGSVLDAVGTDDGATLVIGTSLHLYVVDVAAGTATVVADGRFDRVAIVEHAPVLRALAIATRSDGAMCTTAASRMFAVEGTSASEVATGHFADVAGERGRGFYVDPCTGVLGEVTSAGLEPIRPELGRAVALAVSDGQAWIGAIKIATPSHVALLTTPLDPAATEVRVVFDDALSEVVEATDYPGLERRVDASKTSISGLELGAGGRFIVVGIHAEHFGAAIADVYIPEMLISAEQLRIVEASTGADVVRHRHWCTGEIRLSSPFDTFPWVCSKRGDLTYPGLSDEHHIQSLAVTFGTK